MASTTSRIRIIFDGVTAGVEAAAARARAAVAEVARQADAQDKIMSKVGSGLAVFAKGVALLGSLGGVIGVIAGITAAVQQLLPVVLLAPGAILALGAAYATVKIATAGFADALKGDAEALAKLSPQARATVTALQSLQAPFDKIKRTVQDKFFTGFSGEVRDLGRVYLPVLANGLPKIASGFNEMGRSFAFALKQESTISSVDNLLDNTATLIHNARNALGAFARGFIELGSFGSNYLPKIGIAIDGVAQRFERFVKNGLKDGSLKRYVDDALQGFRDLGAIIGNVSTSIGAVFRALAGPQADVLGGLRDTTAALAAFLQTASAQDSLRALGDALRVIADVTRAVLIAALEQLAPIIENLAPLVAEIAKTFGETLVNALGIVGPLLVGLTGFLKDHKEVVALVADVLLLLYGRFLLLKGITKVVAAIRTVTAALGGLAALGKLAGIVALAAIAVELDKINVAAAGGDPGKLDDVADSLHNIVEAGKALVTLDFKGIIADISDEVTQIGAGFATGSSPIGAFYQTIKDRTLEFGATTKTTFDQVSQTVSTGATGFGAFAGDVGRRLDEAANFLNDLPRRAGVALGQFATTVGAKIDEGVKFVEDFPRRAGDAIGQANAIIGQKASEIWTGFLTSVEDGFRPVKEFFSQSPYEMGRQIGMGIGNLINAGTEVINAVGTGIATGAEAVYTFFATELPARIGAGIATGNAIISQKATELWQAFIDASVLKVTEAVTFATELPGKIGDAITTGNAIIGQKASELWQAFIDASALKITESVTFVQALPGRIGEAIATANEILRVKAVEAWQAFLDGTTAKVTEAVAFVQDIPRRIGEALGILPSQTRTAGQQTGQGFQDGAKGTFDQAVEFVAGIPERIVRALGDLSTLLEGAGRALLAGLTAGMRAGFSALLDFARGIADGIAAVKGPLPYDRRVLTPAGLAMMGGLLAGLRHGSRDVLAFAGGIADGLAGTLDTRALIATGARATTAFGDARGAGAGRGDSVPDLLRQLIEATSIGKEGIKVYLGDQELRSMVRTEIGGSTRQTVRTVRSVARSV